MVTDSQLSMITKNCKRTRAIFLTGVVLLVTLIPLVHAIPLVYAFNVQEQRQQLFGGLSNPIASSPFDSYSNAKGSLTGSSPSTMSLSNGGTHDTNDLGSWYKNDQYNYKYNGYSGHNDNNNYSDKPHKKWHHHGDKAGPLVVNNQNADCSSTSNANGGAGNGGNGGNASGGNGGSSNGGSGGSGGNGGATPGGSGGNGAGGGSSNGAAGGSSTGGPGTGGSSIAGSSTSCSNTSTFNISRG
jgi:hypothetical protein